MRKLNLAVLALGLIMGVSSSFVSRNLSLKKRPWAPVFTYVGEEENTFTGTMTDAEAFFGCNGWGTDVCAYAYKSGTTTPVPFANIFTK